MDIRIEVQVHKFGYLEMLIKQIYVYYLHNHAAYTPLSYYTWYAPQAGAS